MPSWSTADAFPQENLKITSPDLSPIWGTGYICLVRIPETGTLGGEPA